MATPKKSTATELARLMRQAKSLAKQYHALTGRPLGITGEIAEFEAVRLLKLQLADVRQEGYDVIRRRRSGRRERLQVKGRRIISKKPGERIGGIVLTKPWDAVLLVLLDADFEATAIYEAKRAAITRALTRPGSKARNERGALAVSQFKRIAKLVWSR